MFSFFLTDSQKYIFKNLKRNFDKNVDPSYILTNLRLIGFDLDLFLIVGRTARL